MSATREKPFAVSRGFTGFTLLELLVVMVIIGLLAGYVAPRYFSQVGKSEVKLARAQIDAFEKALEAYRLDVGRYLTTEQGLDDYLNNRVPTSLGESIWFKAVTIPASVAAIIPALLDRVPIYQPLNPFGRN